MNISPSLVSLIRPLAYLWASPATLLGLPFAALAWFTGGSVAIVKGVIEIQGGAIAWLLRHATVLKGGAAALTLGHVVLALDQANQDHCRSHERVHVRQYERWGPLFIPAYLLASLWLRVRGRDAYRDNPFEREAYNQNR